MSDVVSRKVAQRALDLAIAIKVAGKVLAKGIPMGKTFQNEKVRIHRYRDQIRVTDLTNAGKRGKKVREMTILPSHKYKGDIQGWLDRNSEVFLTYAKRSSNPYDAIVGYIKDLLVDFPGEIDMHETTYRGVDVEPYGDVFEFKVPVDKGSITIKSSPIDFSVKSTAVITGPRGNAFNQDTLYTPQKKKDAMAFYGWMKDNANKLKSLKSMVELRELWNKIGVKYDYH